LVGESIASIRASEDGRRHPAKSRRTRMAELSEALKIVAPGTDLRSGIDNVIRAGNGGLIVVADPESLGESLVSGGFELGCRFTAMRLYELTKMDGAIVVSTETSTIHHANAQLNPDPNLPSGETGMRHLAAHRTARQTGALAIAISARRKVVTLYLGDNPPRILEDIRVVLGKAESAVATLAKFARRLREQLGLLSLHEYDDTVTLREVVEIVRTSEYAIHITEEIESYLEELGEEGKLIGLQLGQVSYWVPDEHTALLRDYMAAETDYEEAKTRLRMLETDRLPDPAILAEILGYGREKLFDNVRVRPRGYRQLARVPRLPQRIADRLVDEFGSLKRLTEASERELVGVEGVGKVRARAIRRNLGRPEETGAR
jgi:diadenylate cyclase